MVTYSQNLYLSEKIGIKKVNKIKRNIRQGRGRFDLYLISLSNNAHDQLDIIHNSMFKQKLYRKFDIRVVGLAESYDEATGLVMKILDDTLTDTGNADMKSYLLERF
ncbi:MAG: hypothetical protein K5877_06495 [Lachnospiraceae bacterium]|nr:hypothetical protein [Lachnospiraceae bacterium]